MKPIETQFKRIETKYLIPKTQLKQILSDFKHYLVEDDYPMSSITNVYFDTPDYQIIQDSIAKKHLREKIRMRSYHTESCLTSPAFLEIKRKDAQGIGHKRRVMTEPLEIYNLLEKGIASHTITDQQLIEDIKLLQDRYPNLMPRIFIYYERLSLKNRNQIKGDHSQKVRITIDSQLVFRDYDVSNLENKAGYPLLDDDFLIMEIKAASEKPKWLEDILNKHNLEVGKFSKYATAYRKTVARINQEA
ncbi:VTC domain-containing protein [Streptococcus pneumoniae]|nr:VTC domain-containing protein [Streptococcus pneumoniae]